jgi:hypothetical protein
MSKQPEGDQPSIAPVIPILSLRAKNDFQPAEDDSSKFMTDVNEVNRLACIARDAIDGLRSYLHNQDPAIARATKLYLSNLGERAINGVRITD